MLDKLCHMIRLPIIRANGTRVPRAVACRVPVRYRRHPFFPFPFLKTAKNSCRIGQLITHQGAPSLLPHRGAISAATGACALTRVNTHSFDLTRKIESMLSTRQRRCIAWYVLRNLCRVPITSGAKLGAFVWTTSKRFRYRVCGVGATTSNVGQRTTTCGRFFFLIHLPVVWRRARRPVVVSSAATVLCIATSIFKTRSLNPRISLQGLIVLSL